MGIKCLFVLALAISGCTKSEEVCPGMAREMFPRELLFLGIKIQTGNVDAMVFLREGDISTDLMDVRAYICHSYFPGNWQIDPIGIIHIDQKPAERPTP